MDGRGGRKRREQGEGEREREREGGGKREGGREGEEGVGPLEASSFSS